MLRIERHLMKKICGHPQQKKKGCNLFKSSIFQYCNLYKNKQKLIPTKLSDFLELLHGVYCSSWARVSHDHTHQLCTGSLK